MKKLIAICLAAVLALSLAACSGKPAASSSAPATVKDYGQIVKDVRNSDMNEAYAIIADGAVAHNPLEMDDTQAKDYLDTVWTLTGLDASLMQRYALSVSLINIRAYATAVILPAEGKADEVMNNLQAYITDIKGDFENYLPDQYDIAKSAVLRTAKTGEIILVMDENAADTADKIEAALAA